MRVVHMLVHRLLYGILIAMAGYNLDDNLSLAGLTQETREIDMTTISPDDEPFDPDENYRLLIEEACKISSNFSQVSHFDDHIFAMSHRSASSLTQGGVLVDSSNTMASSMVGNFKHFYVDFSEKRCV